ncbi:MAG: hypothetical protein ACR2KL_02040 [Nocardioidaceae bacterium]
MKKVQRVLVPLAAAAVTAVMSPMSAQADSGTNYTATLSPLNNSTGSGMLMMTLNGDQATITENWSGLPASFGGAPYPHVQHIHIGAQGVCPTASADKNGDGVVSTTEGAPAYGAIGTTLSTMGDTSPAAGADLKVAPAGSSTNYSRTITLDSKTLQSVTGGTAVIVVHGLDPATLSKKAQGEKSDLVPSLPLAATSPSLCGALSEMPSGGPQTGYGSTAGPEDLGLFGLGGGLLAIAAGAVVWGRKRNVPAASQS